MNIKSIPGFDFIVLAGLIINSIAVCLLVLALFAKPTSDFNLKQGIREELWKYNINRKYLPGIIFYSFVLLYASILYWTYKIDDLSYLGFWTAVIALSIYLLSLLWKKKKKEY